MLERINGFAGGVQNINEAFVNKKLVVVLSIFIGVGAFQNGK